jgi:hypothetical protein
MLLGLIMIASCGDSDSPGNAENNNISNNDENIPNAENNQNDAEEDTAPPRIDPNLPEKDFEGYTFTFLAHNIDYAGDWTHDVPAELVAEEETGDIIVDAVYRRNMTIKERYNINFEVIPSFDERAALRRAVNAGDDIYDAVVMKNDRVPGIVTGNLLVKTDYLPFIDLSQPWWDPAVNALSIANKNYLMGGDLLILDNAATNGLLFSKDLIRDLGLELPYDTVKEGKWTFDRLHEMIRNAAADLTGDGTMGQDDRWGLGVFNDTMHAFLVGGGGTFASKDENDIPFMDFASQRNLAVLDRAMDILYNQDYVTNQQIPDGLNIRLIFAENRLLFTWGRMHLLEYFRGIDTDFGVVPIPKFDENQQNYHSLVNPFTGVLLGVPKSVDDLEMVSIILEALAAESRYTLQPAYYDVALQRKYIRDEESSEMLDIIFGSRVYDIGGMYSFGDITGDFNALVSRFDRNIVSYYERRSGSMENAINRIVGIFEDMD